eukprot:1797380-Amphidinium_carterae.1
MLLAGPSSTTGTLQHFLLVFACFDSCFSSTRSATDAFLAILDREEVCQCDTYLPTKLLTTATADNIGFHHSHCSVLAAYYSSTFEPVRG